MNIKFQLILFFSLISPCLLKAQVSLLGKSRDFVADIMDSVECKLISKDITTDGKLTFNTYKTKRKDYYLFYFNEKDTCVIVIESAPLFMLVPFIKDFNEKYIKSGDNEWVSKDFKLNIILKVGEEGFNVTYKNI